VETGRGSAFWRKDLAPSHSPNRTAGQRLIAGFLRQVWGMER
jgi:hypothetical protein